MDEHSLDVQVDVCTHTHIYIYFIEGNPFNFETMCTYIHNWTPGICVHHICAPKPHISSNINPSRCMTQIFEQEKCSKTHILSTSLYISFLEHTHESLEYALSI